MRAGKKIDSIKRRVAGQPNTHKDHQSGKKRSEFERTRGEEFEDWFSSNHVITWNLAGIRDDRKFDNIEKLMAPTWGTQTSSLLFRISAAVGPSVSFV